MGAGSPQVINPSETTLSSRSILAGQTTLVNFTLTRTANDLFKVGVSTGSASVLTFSLLQGSTLLTPEKPIQYAGPSLLADYSGLVTGVRYTIRLSSTADTEWEITSADRGEVRSLITTGGTTPVPEAGTVAMTLAGVGMAAVAARRRKAATKA